MRENKYDDPSFFKSYSQMARSTEGLEAAGEWPAFQKLLPGLKNKKVLDLGCGYGWHCRYMREEGASYVLGVDLSEKMLERARANTKGISAIEYRQGAIEEMDFAPGSFAVVISSLALHYVENFGPVCHSIYNTLVPGGTFIFSVEHPIFTANARQDWYYSEEGTRLHWPVDHYLEEGRRETKFLGHQVVKYHRSVASYVNTVIDAGFRLRKLLEPGPLSEMLEAHPDWRDETRRPMFLLIAAVKQE